MSIARLTALLLALAAVTAGCGGGGDERSEEDKVGDVAKQYVDAAANNEEDRCRETLASGVDPELCGDLEPLATRNDPDVKKEAKITGSTARVTVTGAGPVLLDIDLRKQGDDWKVVKWRGYAPGDGGGGSGGAGGDDGGSGDDSGSAGGGY
jgi:hypothetical protein